MDDETDEGLLKRHDNITTKVERARTKLGRMPYGPTRERYARWVGCLEFARLTVRTKMRERGLLPD